MLTIVTICLNYSSKKQ